MQKGWGQRVKEEKNAVVLLKKRIRWLKKKISQKIPLAFKRRLEARFIAAEQVAKMEGVNLEEDV